MGVLLAIACPAFGNGAVKVALVLPFSTRHEAMKARTVEYYEGVLLAVDSLRRTGMSLVLSVFDTGDGLKRTDSLILHGELDDTRLIIGGINEQIPRLANFSAQRGIKYVIPFTPHNDDVLNLDNVFEVNTANSQLYTRIAQAACEEFADCNIIFVHVPDDKEKSDFIRTLRHEAASFNIPCHELTFKPNSFFPDLQTLIANTDRRYLIIPTSSSLEGLNHIRTVLRSLRLAGYNLSLFGYPDWQTFVQDTDDDLYLLNTCIYSSFYVDQFSPSLHRFYHLYHHFFGRNLIHSFPQYGLLGFDTALFFLQSIHSFPSAEPLQTGFRFERMGNDKGGFINTHIFFVRYNSDFSVTRNLIP
jgi:hypothetical protein